MVTMSMMVVAIAEPKPEAIAIAMGPKVVNVVEVVSKAIIVVKVVLIATLFLVLLVRVVVALVRLRVLGIQGFPAPLWCKPVERLLHISVLFFSMPNAKCLRGNMSKVFG